MTQANIYIMDTIVDNLANGKTISQALECVYSKRNVVIPHYEEVLDVEIKDLKMSPRTTNALLRNRLAKVGDIVKFTESHKLTDAKTFGMHSGIELLETILDWCWDHMDNDRRTNFLIDTVERNSQYIRVELI